MLVAGIDVHSQLTINEFLSSNVNGILDEDNENSDWIELYNGSDNALDIAGYALSDDINLPAKWTFPQFIVPAHGHVLVFASGKNRKELPMPQPDGSCFHTNFKIDVDGESICLFNPLGTLIDWVGPLSLPNDISYGRKPDGTLTWLFFSEPSPGTINASTGVEEFMANPVIFNPKGGNHVGGCLVKLSTLHVTDTIYYTTDGSIPDQSDHRYTEPLNISSSQVISARVIKHNVFPGPVATNTYGVSLKHDIPIVCLSTEPANLWDEMTGIFAFGPEPRGDYPYFNANFWKDWERPVHVELYDVNGIKRIDQDAGIKVAGAWSRAADQKSVALFARSAYGKGSFNYKFFTDKPIEKFESILLRNSGNDNMGLQFHDCFMTGLVREMDIDRQAFQPAAIYINGVYWGLLNIREKVSTNFIAENHLVDADSVNLLEGYGNVLDGSNEDYQEILNYLSLNTSLQNDNNYSWVKDRIDIDNFIQYQLTEIYLNNRDWPGNNIKFWNTTAAGSKWRWILYDTDFGYGIWNTNDYMLNTLAFALETNGPDWPNPPWSTRFLRRLLTNPGFRNNFIIQYCDRLNQDFHPNRINADLDSLQLLYDQEIVYNFNRWWGNYDEWLGRINNHRTFGFYRPGYCRQHMKEIFQLGDELEVRIDVSDNKKGTVKLNTIYPKSFPFTGIYFKNIPISMTAIPKPGYKFLRWEGTVVSTDASIVYNMPAAGNFRAVFEKADAEYFAVVINEISYNSSSDLDTKDWIELVNNGLKTVDLSGWLLIDSGIDTGYVFEKGTLIAPGDYLVVCRNLDDFNRFYPEISNSTGNLPFGLSSDGDALRLYDRESHLIDFVNFHNYSPWPDNANGTGASIELIDPALDNARGENWRAVGIGGSPGKPNVDNQATQSPELADVLTPVFDCFPNPFHDFTTIRFNVINEGHYKVEVMDMKGRVVNVLADDHLNQGTYWIDWNGTDTHNLNLDGGVFIVRIINEKSISTKKIIMLK